MSNKYASRSKISEAKFRQLVKLFAIDLDASQIAAVTGLNRNTVGTLVTGESKFARACADDCQDRLTKVIFKHIDYIILSYILFTRLRIC